MNLTRFPHSEHLAERLTVHQLKTYRLARQWLCCLGGQPSLAEQIALAGYYLKQAIGGKANLLLIEMAQADGVEKSVIEQALAMLTELDRGSGCRNTSLESAVLLAETQRFAELAKHAPRRRFIEVSRNYLHLEPAVLKRLHKPLTNSQTDPPRPSENDHQKGEKR